METIWILGAADPEMEKIEGLLVGAYGKAAVFYAAVVAPNGTPRRVAPAEAGRATTTIPPLPPPPSSIITVECAVAGIAPTTVIDHHPPAPAAGEPPAKFMTASSLGQVISYLARQQDLLPDDWIRGEADGWADAVGAIEYYDGEGWAVIVAPEQPACTCGACDSWDTGPTAARIPQDLVLAAAADHCLGAAYAGQCPGVDPEELCRWRTAQRAAFQGRPVDAVLADVEATTMALRDAEWITLNRACPLCGGHDLAAGGGSNPSGCFCDPADRPDAVRDMRREPPWPELPEAATRLRVAYMAGPLADRGGRRKYVVSGPPETVSAFLSWAPTQGLIDVYGAPARGFAGAYLPSLTEAEAAGRAAHETWQTARHKCVACDVAKTHDDTTYAGPTPPHTCFDAEEAWWRARDRVLALRRRISPDRAP